MGQKVSTLGDVFSWKNGESSKNNNDASGGSGSSRTGKSTIITDDACPTNNASAVADQRHFENNIDVPPSSEVAIGVDHDHARFCEASTSTDAGATSKNAQSSKSTIGTKKLNHWVNRFNCSRPKSKSSKTSSPPEVVPEPNDVKSDSCVCTRYERTEDHHEGAIAVFDAPTIDEQQDELQRNNDEDEEESLNDNIFGFNGSFRDFQSYNCRSRLVLPSFDEGIMELPLDMSEDDITIEEDFEDRAYKERAKEIQEGIEPPPGFRPGLHIQLVEFNLPKMTIDSLTTLFHKAAISAFNDMDDSQRIHTSIDYIHYLVPDLLQITNCSFYWGKMDRYEAEKLLENKPEGTFLLRDSAQEEYLFSVSFRKYGRSLHARIEQWNHLFSFDSRDPGVFASSTVCGLIEHYKDPTCCMFFEPMLTIPLNRNFTFSLQHTCRATICNQLTYDDVNQLKLPKLLKSYLKEYHYKQRVRVRIFDSEN